MTGWQALHDLHFLRPVWLLACPVLLLFVWWLARRDQQQVNWSTLIDPALLSALQLSEGSGGTRAGAGAPWPWLALAWSAACLALAGPTWQAERSAAYRAPEAWVVVLDLSPSMAATDLAPSRATRARYLVDDLLRAAKGARVGMVVFSDDAYTVTPLTDDMATVQALLPPLAPDIMPSAGDQLAPALHKAGELLQRAGARGGHVIVLSDGFEDKAGALAAAAALHRQGAAVDVIGLGTTAGAPWRQADGGFAQDSQGHTRLARLDPALMQRLATAGGGQSVPLAQAADWTAKLPTSSPLEASEVAGVQTTRWRDAGVWLLPPLLLLAAWLGRRGWL